jgi:hypothetical protein
LCWVDADRLCSVSNYRDVALYVSHTGSSSNYSKRASIHPLEDLKARSISLGYFHRPQESEPHLTPRRNTLLTSINPPPNTTSVQHRQIRHSHSSLLTPQSHFNPSQMTHSHQTQASRIYLRLLHSLITPLSPSTKIPPLPPPH